MADILRHAHASWAGDLRGGTGKASTESGALRDATVTFPSRFESGSGSNPEELIAAAHAAWLQHGPLGCWARRATRPKRSAPKRL